ncbi:MAG: hypothetical protein J5582_06410 [Ruminococcus sp.]|uniref:zinc ribbon domain-containing protein n=1 Tax=Ruminococcus sp. TaxID=41978 RepID=UPI0025F84623|nr:zinc ribbon domain-containing protein [Ruminococcus sp.]MBO4866191.1 hypothetical protein [Ruminococcus sp.]
MNCPICGAPLGDYDNECKNCGTRRSEMGPAYNNNAGYSQQNSYGYGYGGNGMNGYGGNTMNGGSGYGNYGMNSSFGNNSYTRTQKSSPDVRKLILTLVAVLVFLLTFFVYQYNMNSEHKESFGDISITFPQKLKVETSSVFDSIDADDSHMYSNGKMRFAYIKKNTSALNLGKENNEALYNLIFTLMDSGFEKSLKNYKRKDQLDNHLRFYCDVDGENHFCDMMIDLRDDNCYMYIAYCRTENENKYISKFKKMYDSIEYKN